MMRIDHGRAATKDITYTTTEVKDLMEEVWIQEKLLAKWKRRLLSSHLTKREIKRMKALAWSNMTFSCK